MSSSCSSLAADPRGGAGWGIPLSGSGFIDIPKKTSEPRKKRKAAISIPHEQHLPKPGSSSIASAKRREQMNIKMKNKLR